MFTFFVCVLCVPDEACMHEFMCECVCVCMCFSCTCISFRMHANLNAVVYAYVNV